MRNTFPARDRKFIANLAKDLHFSVTWDQYDDDDQNLVTWHLPTAAEENLDEEGDVDENGEWEDIDDDLESNAAVDRVLKKYEKAPVIDDTVDGGFDVRHDRSIRDKMSEWKEAYYKVQSITITMTEAMTD